MSSRDKMDNFNQVLSVENRLSTLILSPSFSDDPYAARLATRLSLKLGQGIPPINLRGKNREHYTSSTMKILPEKFGEGRKIQNALKNAQIVHIVCFKSSLFWRWVAPTMTMAKYYGNQILLTFASADVETHMDRHIWLSKPFLRMASKLVVPSTHVAAIYHQHGLAAEAIDAPFEPEDYEYNPKKRLQPRLLYDRNLDSTANINCLLRAYEFVKRKYPRAELTVIDNGIKGRQRRHSVQSQLPQEVTIVRNPNEESRREHYYSSDIYVHTATYETEIESILTAFAAGLPVVTTDAGSIPELVENRVNGLVVPVNHHVRIAERIIELIEHQELARQLTEHAKIDVRRFSWKYTQERWKSVYREALLNRNKAVSKASIPDYLRDN